MKTYKILPIAMALALGVASSSAFAVATIAAGTNSGAAGSTVTIPITYTRPAGDANNIFSTSFRINHTNPPITFVSFAAGSPPTNASVACGANMANTFVNCALTTNPPTAIAVGTYTLATITYQIAPGAAAGPQPLPLTVIECTDAGGNDIPGSCNSANGTITVTGGGGNTPPTIGYAPTPGNTINYTGAGTANPIVATPSGGAGSGAAATTTVGACTITGGGAAFPTTNIAQLSFVGATVTPQNIALPNCVPQASAVNATLTCPETAGAGAAVNRVWTLNCPAAAPAGVPPTMTYNPDSGSSTNVPAGNSLTIVAGCPNDGAACGGSGSGLAATTRLSGLVALYTGLASPSPSMSCSFVNQAGANVAAPLDFVATQQDSGNIRCTCPANSTGLPTEPFQVTVLESRPASGGVTATLTFNIICQGAPPPACGTIAANPASGTINLSNGGGASQVATVSLTGAGAGVSHTVSCLTGAAPSGSSFNVTTAPSPLTLSNATTSGTVSATCTNTNVAAVSVPLTCTSTAVGAQGCTNLNVSYTLSCPGVTVQPPPSLIPVPALNEQGRILLAALVLLMGLGVVGFRMRG